MTQQVFDCRNYRTCITCGIIKSTKRFRYMSSQADGKGRSISKVCTDCEAKENEFTLTVLTMPFNQQMNDALHELPASNRHLETFKRYLGHGYFPKDEAWHHDGVFI